MMKTKLIFLSIILMGLLLRILFINSNPLSLYGDELTIALDANSILNTGRDQLGNIMPLTFPMGAGRPAGYVYFSIPFIALFGPTSLGVRGLSILSGVGIILLLFYIGKKLFSERVGLYAAALCAISPWDISLSRGGFEAHFALFLVLLGIYFFIKAKEKPLFYIFSALSFGLTLHTYPTYKVSLILFLPLLLWYQGIKNTFSGKERKHFLIGVALFLFLGVIAISQIFIGGSEKRFSNINIFSQEKIKGEIEQKINLERSISNLPQLISKYFHNKPLEYTKIFIENYLQNFSMDFLVLHGDRNPRHNMTTMGQVFFAQMVLIFLGILTFCQKNKKLSLFLIFWLIIAPIPTAIIDLPHALRSSFMLPPLIIFSALGLLTILNTKNKQILILVGILFIIQFLFFIQKLYFLAPNEYSYFWSYSAKVASELAIQNKDRYKYIFLSDGIDSIEFAYPVYSKTNPLTVINQNENVIEINGYSFKKFDNVYIGAIPSGDLEIFLRSVQGSILYIGDPSDIGNLSNYETISGPTNLKSLILTKRGI